MPAEPPTATEKFGYEINPCKGQQPWNCLEIAMATARATAVLRQAQPSPWTRHVARPIELKTADLEAEYPGVSAALPDGTPSRWTGVKDLQHVEDIMRAAGSGNRAIIAGDNMNNPWNKVTRTGAAPSHMWNVENWNGRIIYTDGQLDTNGLVPSLDWNRWTTHVIYPLTFTIPRQSS